MTTFPCVVKAPDRQGQRGLTLVQTPPALADAIRDAVAASRGGSCLVEQLIDGPELTVNGFSVDGAFHTLTLTDRLTAEPPAFGVALAHVWPSFLSADVVAAVAETAGRAVTALGIESGPSYTQLRVGPEGPAVIEVAARLGGGHDAELCEATLGVELNRLALAAALGEEVTTVDLRAEARAGGGCTRFLVPSQGELRRVEGVEAARIAAGVVAVYIYRSPGHRFGPLRLGADRAGAVLATGASRAEAVERADRAADLIRFDAVDAGTEAFVER